MRPPRQEGILEPVARRRSKARVCLHAVFVLGMPAAVLAQERSPADGPWSGQAQCVLSARGPDYQEEQTHTWRLTGGPPRVTGSVRHWPAVWSVQGRGRRSVPSPTRAPASETWTITVPETSAPIAIWEIPPGGRVRIGSQHGLLVANGAIDVTSSIRQRAAYSIQEWEFPANEDAAVGTVFSGTRSRPIPLGPSWRRPPDVPTTETCTWSFTRGSAVQSSVTTPAAGAMATGGAAVTGRGRVTGAFSAAASPVANCAAISALAATFDRLSADAAAIYATRLKSATLAAERARLEKERDAFLTAIADAKKKAIAEAEKSLEQVGRCESLQPLLATAYDVINAMRNALEATDSASGPVPQAR